MLTLLNLAQEQLKNKAVHIYALYITPIFVQYPTQLQELSIKIQFYNNLCVAKTNHISLLCRILNIFNEIGGKIGRFLNNNPPNGRC